MGSTRAGGGAGIRSTRAWVVTACAVALFASGCSPPAPPSPPVNVTGEAAWALLLSEGDVALQANSLELTEEELHQELLRDSTLRVTPDGDLVWQEAEALTLDPTTGPNTRWNPNPTAPTSETFLLHSRPGSSNTIYLDFRGHTDVSPAWRSQLQGQALQLPPWSIDSSIFSFNNTEHAVIQNVWASVRDDFAPFDVDVTTEDPGTDALTKTSASDTTLGQRVVFTNVDFFACGCGGLAFNGSFGGQQEVMALVMQETTIDKGLAEAASHEIGHTLKLIHKGTVGANPADYHEGDPITMDGNATRWAPIMGTPYYGEVTQWSEGEYPNASNTTDEVRWISTPFSTQYTLGPGAAIPVASDDYTDFRDFDFAPQLIIDAPPLRGIHEREDDVDVFRFSFFGAPRTLRISALSENDALTDTNADLAFNVWDSAGNFVYFKDPAQAQSASSISLTLAGGTSYFVEVYPRGYGVGSPSNGYSRYGSLGRYKVSLDEL